MGIVVTPSPSMTNCLDGSEEHVINTDLLPDIWCIVPLSNIVVREADMRCEHVIDLITRATIFGKEDSRE